MNNQKTCHSSLSQCLQSYDILKVSSICQVHFCRSFIRILSWQTWSFVSMHLLHLYLIWKNLWQLHHSGFQNHHAVHSELLPFLSQNRRKMLYTFCQLSSSMPWNLDNVIIKVQTTWPSCISLLVLHSSYRIRNLGGNSLTCLHCHHLLSFLPSCTGTHHLMHLHIAFNHNDPSHYLSVCCWVLVLSWSIPSGLPSVMKGSILENPLSSSGYCQLSVFVDKLASTASRLHSQRSLLTLVTQQLWHVFCVGIWLQKGLWLGEASLRSSTRSHLNCKGWFA